jgi:hypothetical protein
VPTGFKRCVSTGHFVGSLSLAASSQVFCS